MCIAKILRLDPDEVWPAYRQLAIMRRVYRGQISRPEPPTPRALQHKYRAALVTLDTLESELKGVSQYEDMRELCRGNTSAALRLGRPQNAIALQWFIGELAAIYVSCTNQKPVCYWNGMSEQYGGDFFSLCQAVDNTINGKAVARILNSIR